MKRRFPKRSRMQNAPEAQSELHYLDIAAIGREIARLKTTVRAIPGFTEAFITAPSPGIVSTTMYNAYYDSHEAYLAALAREMSKEYRAIYDAGFILQIDSPDLAMDRTMFYRDLSDAQFVAAAPSMSKPWAHERRSYIDDRRRLSKMDGARQQQLAGRDNRLQPQLEIDRRRNPNRLYLGRHGAIR